MCRSFLRGGAAVLLVFAFAHVPLLYCQGGCAWSAVSVGLLGSLLPWCWWWLWGWRSLRLRGVSWLVRVACCSLLGFRTESCSRSRSLTLERTRACVQLLALTFGTTIVFAPYFICVTYFSIFKKSRHFTIVKVFTTMPADADRKCCFGAALFAPA